MFLGPDGASGDGASGQRVPAPVGDADDMVPGLAFATAALREGFVAPSLKLAVLPEHRLLRRRRAQPSAGPRTGAGVMSSFTDLRVGVPVVHEDHGIGLFTGFETKTVGGVTRDYLQLEFTAGLPVIQTLHDYKLACPNTSFVSNGRICEACKGGKYYNMTRYRCKRGSTSASLLATARSSATIAISSRERRASIIF